MSKLPRTVFRQLDGILLLDKPPGMSSNQALQRVRHLFRAEKAGHTGSLDPLATGLLPVCFGEATKIAGYLLGSDKAYEVEARLGSTTDTDDADGVLLRERPVPALDRTHVQAEMQAFVGRIHQRPPIYSALKQGGEPLYAKARRGEKIEVPEREVDVQAIELLSLDADRLRLRIRCGTGTYVRSIVRDLGEALGCGAHVTALRRLWVAPFNEPAMHSLESLQTIASNEGEVGLEKVLMPTVSAFANWRKIALDAEGARRLLLGQAVATAIHQEGVVCVFGAEGEALGVAELHSDGVLRPRRLFSRKV
ncbi:MAG: tRNA pseudouridine(55) synthase TruB [Arenimonas sp.]